MQSSTGRGGTSLLRPSSRSTISSAKRRRRSPARWLSVRVQHARACAVKARVPTRAARSPRCGLKQAGSRTGCSPDAEYAARKPQGQRCSRCAQYDVNGVCRDADFAPVYPASAEITVKKLREVVGKALEYAGDVVDPLPADLKAREALQTALMPLVALHRPPSEEQGERARRRLAFDELTGAPGRACPASRGRAEERAPALGAPGELVDRIRALLPSSSLRAGRARLRRSTQTLRARPYGAAAPG